MKGRGSRRPEGAVVVGARPDQRPVVGNRASRPARGGGQTAVYFETEIDDDSICSAFGFCVGFVINIIDADGNVSGWSFEPGYRSRVWWVDQGTEPPLVIIATTPSTDRTFESTADALLATLVIGEPAPHPVDLADSGVTLNG